MIPNFGIPDTTNLSANLATGTEDELPFPVKQLRQLFESANPVYLEC